MRSETPRKAGRSKAASNITQRAGRLPQSIRAAKARALVAAIESGFYRGELTLDADAYTYLRRLGLSRAEVHRAAADLEADRRVMVLTAGPNVVLRLVGTKL